MLHILIYHLQFSVRQANAMEAAKLNIIGSTCRYLDESIRCVLLHFLMACPIRGYLEL